MLWAINKKLYENCKKDNLSEKESIIKSKCFSVFIKEDNFNLFKDNILKPEHKEFYGYNRITGKVLTNQQWTYVKEQARSCEGNQYNVRPFFTPSCKEVKYKTYNPESKENVHSIAQDILLAEFLEGSLKIHYHGLPITLKELNFLKQKECEDYLEVTKSDKELFKKQINFKEERRADMLIELNNFNEKFGKGFVFEIYNTESDISIDEKKNDWNNMGYSYIAIDISHFNILNESTKKNRTINVLPFLENEILKKIQNINQDKINVEAELEYIKSINKTELNLLKEKVWKLTNEINERNKDSINISESLRSKLKKDILQYDNQLELKSDLLKDIESKMHSLIESELDKFSDKFQDVANQIKENIIIKVKEDQNIQKLDKIYETAIISDDFKNKLQKYIFNDCEKTRIFCLNIIKKNIDKYFEEKKEEFKKQCQKD